MIHHLRSRLRVIVATAICALVAAPALVTGTATTAGAVTPGVATGVLTVGGESNALGNSNPWRFGDATAAYAGLRGELVDLDNFGPSGVVKKGRFQVAPGIDEITSATLANLDVFVGGIQRNGDGSGNYSASEKAALQAFNANGGALVLMNNSFGFGNLSDWLGFTLRPQRAFYGNNANCGTTAPDEHSPTAMPITPVGGAHPITTTGTFGASGNLFMYHTGTVMTALPGTATARYAANITGQAPSFAITGPVGDTNAGFTIQTAAISSSGIISVAFSSELGPISTDSSFPYTADGSALGVGPHTLTATAALVGGGSIVSNMAITVVAAPVVETFHDCPGANGEGVDNNLTGTTVATINAGALGSGSGPIVVTTDLDFFSNFFTGSALAENRTFALNAFGWIMDTMLPDVPDDTYFSLPNPERVYDSRPLGAVAHNAVRDIQVAGLQGVPGDARTVVANVTVVDPDSSGYLTVFPTGKPRPGTSTHNFGPGEEFANMIVMQVGDNGRISVYDYLDSQSGSTHVLVDVIGYTRRDNGGVRLNTMAPGRILDTRDGTGLPKAPFGPGQTQHLTVRGPGTGVPGDADSVVLNMTVTGATNSNSFVTAWPKGSPQPNVSNLNNVVGVARPNLVVAKVGADNQISIANALGTADIIADVVGYFRTGAYKSGGVITGLTPDRIFDTRPSSAFNQNETRSIQVAGRGGIPGTAKTAILKVTVASPTDGGFLTVWPAGTATPPNVSNLNFGPGMTIPNLVVIQLGTSGQINIYNAIGSAQVLVDVLGYAD